MIDHGHRTYYFNCFSLPGGIHDHWPGDEKAKVANTPKPHLQPQIRYFPPSITVFILQTPFASDMLSLEKNRF
jgi:hypothetical protein